MSTTSLFVSVVALTKLGAVAGKKTIDCFSGTPFSRRRDPNITRWLPRNQSDAGACTIATAASSGDATYMEWTAAFLGVPANTSLGIIYGHLKERHHILTLPQLEKMAQSAWPDSNASMVDDGWSNFGFVENTDGSISVVDLQRDGSRSWWKNYIYNFDYPVDWTPSVRYLIPNICNSMPGLSGI